MNFNPLPSSSSAPPKSAQPGPSVSTVFAQIQWQRDLLGQMRELAAKLGSIADRMAGPIPTAEQKGNAILGGGIGGEIAQNNSVLAELLADIDQHAERIGNHLG